MDQPTENKTCLSNLHKCEAECCKIILIRLKNLSLDAKRYYSLRRCRFVKEGVLIPLKCSMLDENNRCKIHNRNKPYFCKRGYTEIKEDVYYPEHCIYKPEKGGEQQ